MRHAPFAEYQNKRELETVLCAPGPLTFRVTITDTRKTTYSCNTVTYERSILLNTIVQLVRTQKIRVSETRKPTAQIQAPDPNAI